MLNSRSPTLFELDKALERFSHRRRQPNYTISKTERFPIRNNSASTLSPGQYKMDVEIPMNMQTEILSSRLTRSSTSPTYTFRKESRVHRDEILKGISTQYCKETLPLGPGQYQQPRMGSRTYKERSPAFSWWVMWWLFQKRFGLETGWISGSRTLYPVSFFRILIRRVGFTEFLNHIFINSVMLKITKVISFGQLKDAQQLFSCRPIHNSNHLCFMLQVARKH